MKSDLGILVLLALASITLHSLTNNQYGFHRDELQTLEDARHLDWGYVAYPPVTPLIGRLALTLFGTSLIGFRFFATVAVSVAMIFTGLIARELGGGRREQVLAAVAAAISPIILIQGAVFQYVSFDYLWGVLATYFLVCLANSGDARWWLAIGCALGLGMQTRYTAGFLALGIAAAVLLTPARRDLRTRWLWLGAALSVVIFLPNLLWQMQHDFISLDFLSHIHARDIRQGRTEDFLVQQFLLSINVATAPLTLLGLWFYLLHEEGKRFRVLGWMFVVTFVLFLLAKGRFYYTAPLYPAVLAAGSVAFGKWLDTLRIGVARIVHAVQWMALLVGGVAFGLVVLPVAPIGSPLWNVTSKIHDQFREEVGWTDLAQNVAQVFNSLPPEERAQAGILTGNYGEAGALNLYGPDLGLPRAVAGTNSFWLRGFDPRMPQTVILVGFDLDDGKELFTSCSVAAKNTNRYGVENEESRDHPDILLCRGLRQP
ncbi:MAG: glycosyltransferase family 39 protein [Acidobacteria bacterium]|nr:glycosyltransferase family 39 protein [Acidobacteriota bacterium]